MKYKLNLTLPENPTDNYGNLKPSVVLNLFQSVATGHSVELGVDYDKMKEKNLLWVVSRIYYKVIKKDFSGNDVTVTTWPLAPNRLGYERDYIVTDSNGDVIIKGISNWAVIDATSRKLVINQDLYNTEELLTEKVLDDKIRRIKNFESEVSMGEVIPDQSMIDGNNHVNNTFYAKFATDAIGDIGGEIKTFQIGYHREVLCGEKVIMSVATLEDGIKLAKGEDEEGNLKFCAQIEGL